MGNPDLKPELTIQYYAPNSGNVTIAVLSEDGQEVHSMTVTADKGVNEVKYDLSITDSGKRLLEKEDVSIEKASNGVMYLPKGTYTLTLKMGSMEASKSLELK